MTLKLYICKAAELNTSIHFLFQIIASGKSRQIFVWTKEVKMQVY